MYLEINQADLLKPLKMIAGIVERKQTMAILGNVLMRVNNNQLTLCATDSELVLFYEMPLQSNLDGNGETTIPALKLFDICRSLDSDAKIQILQEDGSGSATIKSARSRFTLSCLDASQFPVSEETEFDLQFSLPQKQLKTLLSKTQFAMAQQDVRYYLNGVLFDLYPDTLKVIATDGHRLALIETSFPGLCEEPRQVIIPRKAILELSRSLQDNDDPVTISVNPKLIQFEIGGMTLRSKLIEGNFPSYDGVLPDNILGEINLSVQIFKQALSRMAILSHEKHKNVTLKLDNNLLYMNSYNPEQKQELGEENLDIDYTGEHFEISFNIQYLLDVLNVMDSESINFKFSGIDTSSFITPVEPMNVLYVVMPMRL